MPIFEFKCPVHGKFEVICEEKYDTFPCQYHGEPGHLIAWGCEIESDKVEWSVPARRNPMHGEQK